MPPPEANSYLPVLIVAGLAICFAGVSLGASEIVSRLLMRGRRRSPVKDMPYECGMPILTDAHTRFSVKFYIVAMLFILFDIEVVFLYPIGVILKDADSLFVLGELVVFVVLLLVAFVYVWRKGALDWR